MEIIKIEKKKKIDKAKSWFFEKCNKINKILANHVSIKNWVYNQKYSYKEISRLKSFYLSILNRELFHAHV